MALPASSNEMRAKRMQKIKVFLVFSNLQVLLSQFRMWNVLIHCIAHPNLGK